MIRVALALCLLLAAEGTGVGEQAPLATQFASDLASLATSGNALGLWQRAVGSAAASIVDALRKQDPSRTVELHGTDLEDLRIWHGQSVALGLEADGQAYRYVVSSEPQWKSLAHVLPASQGGLLPRHDWDAIERDWLNPVAHGSLLPDFGLEGPIDLYLSSPTALQLFLPHASDAGIVQRVQLRQGAVVMVRGARSVRLRRALDLPAISLSEFADIVTSDSKQQQPLGVVHLLAGVQAAAQAHWNSSHPDQSLGLVALELDLSAQGAALLAAPTSSGGQQRLKVRRVKQGVIELLPRDSPAAVSETAGALAVPMAAPPPAGAWPLTSVHPMQLQSYERLLRQIISSRLFRLPAGAQPAFRIAQDVQLRLLETEAQATTLLQMKLELERNPKPRGSKGAAAGDGKESGAASAGSAGSGDGKRQQQQAAQLFGEDPPDAVELLTTRRVGRVGPHETWLATVQVKGDARRGTLKFVPLHLQRVGAAHDTVQFAPEAFYSMYGMNSSEILFQ